MTVIGLMLIGAVMGWGCCAILNQRQREEFEDLKNRLRHAEAVKRAADDMVQAQHGVIEQQRELIRQAHEELSAMASEFWPAHTKGDQQ